MRDVSESFPDEHQSRTVAEVERMLDGLAAIHAAFWQAPELADPALGLCDCTAYVSALSPETARRLPSSSSPMPQLLTEGWPLLQAELAPDVVTILGELMADPQPLCAALARYPATLLHGDYRVPNLALPGQPSSAVVALDWGNATYGPVTVDLAWLLDRGDVQSAPISTESAVAAYRQRLAGRLGNRFDDDEWQPMWELAVLVTILRIGCFRAWFVRRPRSKLHQAANMQALAQYNERVRAAVKWL
jgi:Ser/Thr protein kinase RdoA (MazF antagonist)